ncbi:hypothetical protein CSC70_03940 [Pseudoxanthomonas kalamensis DSM 18571]|uniref:DUF7173 family protein n=1 Tax=Pseudoxanthomonas kalamensis TaxID=289483 RepID=UPI001391C65B|nr:hypothetical protein [Pseudoxanthomonas kalamensis]KAF1711087.1 hypothetical protein CSC70_03940 [Pseudoxanthomonas kalamensis DSM 18571]
MNFDEKAALYEQRKQELNIAQTRLNEAHEALLADCVSRNEGSATTTGSNYKVTVTYGMNRTVDQAALNALWERLPEGARRVFPVKHGIDTKELRYWQSSEPDTYALIAQAITAKPSKPSVKVERIETAANAA